MSLRQSENIRQGIGPYAGRPDQCVGFNLFPRPKTHKGGSYLCDRFSQTNFNSSLLKFFFSVRTQIVFERSEYFLTHLNNDYARVFSRELVIIVRQKVVCEIRERTRYLNARGPGADNDKIQYAVFNQRRVAVGRFESLQDSVAKGNRIHQSVKRKRMLRCTRRIEVVNSGSSREDQVVVRDL